MNWDYKKKYFKGNIKILLEKDYEVEKVKRFLKHIEIFEEI